MLKRMAALGALALAMGAASPLLLGPGRRAS